MGAAHVQSSPYRPQGRAQRPVPVRLRQEIQAVLRRRGDTLSRSRPDVDQRKRHRMGGPLKPHGYGSRPDPCRAREKRHRRGATPRGRLLKSQQNQRYRLKHEGRERQRRRQWRLNHPREYRGQKERELTRRSLRTGWNQRRFRQLPASAAAIMKEGVNHATAC